MALEASFSSFHFCCLFSSLKKSYSGASLYLHFNLLCDTSVSLFFSRGDNYNHAALEMRSQCLHIVWHNNTFLFSFSLPFLVGLYYSALYLWFLMSTEWTCWNHGGWYFTLLSFPKFVVANLELIVASEGRVVFLPFYISPSPSLNFS